MADNYTDYYIEFDGIPYSKILSRQVTPVVAKQGKIARTSEDAITLIFDSKIDKIHIVTILHELVPGKPQSITFIYRSIVPEYKSIDARQRIFKSPPIGAYNRFVKINPILNYPESGAIYLNATNDAFIVLGRPSTVDKIDDPRIDEINVRYKSVADDLDVSHAYGDIMRSAIERANVKTIKLMLELGAHMGIPPPEYDHVNFLEGLRRIINPASIFTTREQLLELVAQGFYADINSDEVFDQDFNLKLHTGVLYIRDLFTRVFGWSVPNQRSLDALIKFIGSDKVLEVGGGRGLWSALLQRSGVDATCTSYSTIHEHKPISDDTRTWTDVILMDAETAIKTFSDRNCLFMSWPYYYITAIEYFKGDKIVVIGEGPGGATDDISQVYPAFDDYTEIVNPDDGGFEQVGTIDIPQWPGIHDKMFLYARKSSL